MLLTLPRPRNAISDLSITPLCPKTSSVPLDGRVFKVATLDADLATELEGATLFEEAGSKGNYVVFWYQLSHLENIGEIRAELLKATNNTPLFRGGYWEPSLIPHLLRQSTIPSGASNSCPLARGPNLIHPKKALANPHPSSPPLLQVRKGALERRSGGNQSHATFLTQTCKRLLKDSFLSLVPKRLALLLGSMGLFPRLPPQLCRVIPADLVWKVGMKLVLRGQHPRCITCVSGPHSMPQSQ